MRWLLLFLFLLRSIEGKQLELPLKAEGAILINAKTGAILYEKNAYTPTFPASTTKIATAIYALHCAGLDLERILTATKESIASISPQAKKQSQYRSPPYWLETDGGHIGIKAGEEFSLSDLLAAVLVSSANDAANVVASGLGGTIPRFMEGVNRYLKELGCRQTVFNNPHGLHHPDHTTTPYDLALMAKKGLEHPFFEKLVRTVRYECPRTNLEYERTFVQTNLLLRQGAFSYSKAIGVKTGTTQAAGKNLVAAAEDRGRRLIAVMLGCREGRSQLYRDMIDLFEVAFNEPKMRRTLLKKGATEITATVAGARGLLRTAVPEGVVYDFYPSEECAVKAQVKWTIPPLPIEARTVVGTIEVIDERGIVLSETKLLAYADLKPTLWFRITHFFSEKSRIKKGVFFAGVALFSFLAWRIKKRRARRPLF